MALIRLRKKYLLVSGIVGALLIGIPLFSLLLFTSSKMNGYSSQVKQFQEQYKTKVHVHAFVVENGIKKGDIVKDTDIRKIEISADGSDIINTDSKKIIGKSAKINITSGMIITNDMVYDHEDIGNDIRLQEYSFITMPEFIAERSYIDIRITFPNGEDYVVAEHKRVEGITKAGLNLYVDESEILKLASSYVDMKIYKGTKVYGVLYVTDYQEAAEPNYPVNSYICKLSSWDPNIIKQIFTEQNIINRSTLEGNLLDFMGVSNNWTEDISTDSPE